MTSITSAASSQLTSPLSILQNELSSEVSSGKISSTDETALSSALKDIDAALKSQSSSGTSAGDVKSKIDDLIDAEVKDGKLTADQASELKNVFAQAFGSADSAGTTTDADATGGSSAASSGSSSSSSSSTTTSTDPADTNKDGVVSAAERAAYDAKEAKATSGSSDTGSSSSNVADLLRDFLAVLRSSTDSSSSYTANGQKNAVSQSASQVVDYQA